VIAEKRHLNIIEIDQIVGQMLKTYGFIDIGSIHGQINM